MAWLIAGYVAIYEYKTEHLYGVHAQLTTVPPSPPSSITSLEFIEKLWQ